VLSARTIPGNELKVARLVDALAEQGAQVVDGARAPHVSGHGNRGDLAQLLQAVRPESFAALHGDARHLMAHRDLAQTVGLEPAALFNLKDGASLVVTEESIRLEAAREPAAEPYAAFGHVIDDATVLVAARQRMKSAGVLVVTARGQGVDFITRGVFPDVDATMRAELGALASMAFAAAHDDDVEAKRAIARVFKKRDRAVPEIVLVRGGDLPSPS
jgi:mRNA degradation ribonuclease J1/J2